MWYAYLEAGTNDPTADSDIISPQPLSTGLRRSTRTKKPNSRYAYHVRRYDWADSANDIDFDLVLACASEVITALPSNNDALFWEPAPRSIRDILKMPQGPVRQAWLKSVWKELKALVDSGTFAKPKGKMTHNANTP